MAWTAADINRLAQGSNNQKKWTANDIATLAKGTNSQKADTKEQAAKNTDPDITRAKALQQYTERHISDMGEVDARNEPSQARSGRKENLSPFPSADAARERSSPDRATATTAACGRSREELLGPWPAGRECRSRHEMDAGSHNPIAFLGESSASQ